jgi:hypothetical protein
MWLKYQLRNNRTVFEELEVSIVDLIIAICSFTVDEKLSQYLENLF